VLYLVCLWLYSHFTDSIFRFACGCNNDNGFDSSEDSPCALSVSLIAFSVIFYDAFDVSLSDWSCLVVILCAFNYFSPVRRLLLQQQISFRSTWWTYFCCFAFIYCYNICWNELIDVSLSAWSCLVVFYVHLTTSYPSVACCCNSKYRFDQHDGRTFAVSLLHIVII
jgi:hypothetical protein